VALTDDRFMDIALAEAAQGLAENEVPIGAVAVLYGDVLAAAHWRLRPDFRLLEHPELIVLRAAEAERRLARTEREAVTLYTTLEPCLLCMGATMSFMAGRVVFALESPSDGASGVADVWRPPLGHPSGGHPYTIPHLTGGVRRDDSLALMRQFVARNPDAAWAKTLLPPDGS
jgi:tRNA(adenine34) deaminase